MAYGVNRALIENPYKMRSITNVVINNKKPCIFLFHRNLNIDMINEFGRYIMSKGLDVYIYTKDLYFHQIDSKEKEAATIDLIQTGIKSSTHTICLLGLDTIDSWWVPYQLGCAHDKEIAILKLKDLNREKVPLYFKNHNLITGWKDVDIYIYEIIKKNMASFSLYEKIYNDEVIKFSIENSNNNNYIHPLSKYMDKY